MLIAIFVLSSLALIAAGFAIGFLSSDIKDRKRIEMALVKAQDDQIQLVSNIHGSHQLLVETQAQLDQKLTEQGLRLSQLTSGTSIKAKGPFG